MSRRLPNKNPWYAIRKRKGPLGIVYQVRLRRAGKLLTESFPSNTQGTAREALRAARAWRDRMIAFHAPETKRAFSERAFPHNTSGCPGVYLRRQVVQRSGKEYAYLHWQAQSPAGAKPWRSRSFSVDRYGYDEAYLMAVEARRELVALVEGYVGVSSIPRGWRPSA